MISTVDLAWAAGFLEGEGSFRHAQTSAEATASQVQREPLERLQRLFGGSIVFRKRIFVWTVSGYTARGVMMTLFVFMSPKRKQEIKNALGVWRASLSKMPHRLKEECPRGHPYSHVIVRTAGQKYQRYCRICRTESQRRTRERLRRVVGLNDWT